MKISNRGLEASHRQIANTSASRTYVTRSKSAHLGCGAAGQVCRAQHCSSAGLGAQKLKAYWERLPALIAPTALVFSLSLMTAAPADAGTPFTDAAELTGGLRQGCASPSLSSSMQPRPTHNPISMAPQTYVHSHTPQARRWSWTGLQGSHVKLA